MKILIINTVSFKLNGMTNVICQQFKSIDGESYKCDIAGSNEPVHSLYESVKKNKRRFFILPNRKKNPIKYIYELTKICKINKYQVVYAHGNSATLVLEMLAAKLSGVKIRVVHAHSVSCKHRILHVLLRKLMVSLSTHRIACSDMAGHFLCGDDSFYVIPNSFDVEKFIFDDKVRAKIRHEFDLNNKIVIGYVATLTENKNHFFLLDVVAEYKKMHNNVILLCVGKGPFEDEIKKKINSMNLNNNVILLGERSDVCDLINAFDYVLFPSKYEGLGIALLEAQTNGLPTLATADTIPKEVKINDNFQFCKLGDAKLWCNELMKLPVTRELNGYINLKRSIFSKEKQDELWKRLINMFE